MNKATRTATALLGSIAAVSLFLTGCNSNANGTPNAQTGTVTQADIDKAMQTPTDLTFWTWVPDIQNEVNLFEKKYPAIKVHVENVGQGLPHYQKLRSAIQAGKGAPDVAQIEYQYIPSFVLPKSLLDLAPYGASSLSKDYVDWAWKQVAPDKQVWALPQDIGSMGNLYRNDIMTKAGITQPPTTWDQYAADAKTVKDKTGSYISDLSPTNASPMLGYFWQAGVKPFTYDGGKTVGIDVNSAAAKKVGDYWTKLVQQGYVATDVDFTDTWYQGLATGKYAGWIAGAWAPVFLQGTAKDTSGKWRVADLPQWSSSEPASGNQGGASDAVLASSKNPIAAYELVKFLNNDKESSMMLATKQFLYPPLLATLQDPAFADEKLPFYGGQQVNKMFADISKTVDTNFQWLPFMDYVYSSYEQTMGPVVTSKGDISAALDKWQDQLVSYAKSQGFTVK